MHLYSNTRLGNSESSKDEVSLGFVLWLVVFLLLLVLVLWGFLGFLFFGFFFYIFSTYSTLLLTI